VKLGSANRDGEPGGADARQFDVRNAVRVVDNLCAWNEQIDKAVDISPFAGD
jgi:hypothetical protein